MGLGGGSGILHQAVAGALPVTRDGGASGYVAAEAASSRRVSESSASATLGRPSTTRGRATAPRVRGHREAARHLRQAGLRVADHVITFREFRRTGGEAETLRWVSDDLFPEAGGSSWSGTTRARILWGRPARRSRQGRPSGWPPASRSVTHSGTFRAS